MESSNDMIVPKPPTTTCDAVIQRFYDKEYVPVEIARQLETRLECALFDVRDAERELEFKDRYIENLQSEKDEAIKELEIIKSKLTIYEI